jgi:hypothetical protein
MKRNPEPRMAIRAVGWIMLIAVGAISLGWAPLPAAASFSAIDSGSVGSVASTATHVNVAIQAGHWKTNELPDVLARLRGSTGTSGGGYAEWQVNLNIANRTAQMLRTQGLTVEVLPATIPTGYQADLFIALHADGNSSARARGYKVSTRWRSDVAGQDVLLTQTLGDAYQAVTGLPEDPSVTRAMRGYYAYSTYRGEEYRLGATTPGVILEMAFLTSPADRALLIGNPDKVARGVVAGVNAYYRARTTASVIQDRAERTAATAPAGRSAVVMVDQAVIRAAGRADAPRVSTAAFGASFALLEASNTRPTGAFNPAQGTQLVSGSGWYKIAVPGQDSPAYISRDVVVVQQ